MEHIDNLRVFCSVVETLSFTRTAEMLGLSPAVVSRAIGRMEERLGVRLFNRTTRYISLADASENLYRGYVRILADLDAIEQGASTQAREPVGTLRVIAHATTTTTRLVPLIATFKQKCPKVSIDITLAERPVDIVAEGFDVGLVLPFTPTSDTVVTRLLERIPFAVVASPDYLRRHPAPCHPSDLQQHVFVAMSPSIRKPELTFGNGRTRIKVRFRFEIASNNAFVNLGLVQSGFGLGLLPIALVQNDIAAGRLVLLLQSFKIYDAATELRLAYSSRALLPEKIRAFTDHAVDFFERFPFDISGTA